MFLKFEELAKNDVILSKVSTIEMANPLATI